MVADTHPFVLRSRSRQACSTQMCMVLLGMEELAGDETTSGPQLQWATLAEFPNVREVIRARLSRNSAHGDWGRRHFCSSCRSGRCGRFRHAGRRSGSTSHGGDHLELHIIHRDRSNWSHLVRARWMAPLFLGWSGLLQGSKDVAESRKPLLNLLLVPRTKDKHASVVRLPKGQRSVRLQVGLLQTVRVRAELRTAMLAHMEGCAGRLAVLEVSGAAPIPTPRSSGAEMLGMPAAMRKSRSPALHEASTLLGTAASVVSDSRQASLRCSIKKRCAFQFPTSPLGRGICKRSLEEEFGVDPGVATTEAEHT